MAAAVTAQPRPQHEAPTTELPVVDAQPLLAAAPADPLRGLASVVITQSRDGGGRSRYRVAAASSAEPPILVVDEDSRAVERCLPCRALTLTARAGGDATDPVVLEMDKAWHWCMCPWPALLHPLICACAAAQDLFLAGPAELFVRDGATGAALGVVSAPPGPAFWCRGSAVVRRAADRGGDAFGVGPAPLWGAAVCPCASSDAVPVFDAGGRKVATIHRLRATACEVLRKTNRVRVDVGAVRDPADRSLLLAAALLFDVVYWDYK